MTILPVTTVIAAASSYDLTNVQTIKEDISLAKPDFDANFARWITVASTAAAKFCNRVFPVETLQDEFFPEQQSYPRMMAPRVGTLQLTRWPIAGVTPCLAGTAPPVAPALSVGSDGSLAASPYYVRVTYLTANGETAVSGQSFILAQGSRLLQVASPSIDLLGLATGWNVYVGTAGGQGTLQNASPLTLGSAWIEPTSGLISSGAALPSFVSVIENSIPLCEGIDFLVKPDIGQLLRLDVHGYPKHWPALSLIVLYQAGYATIPADVEDAVILLVKKRYYGRARDPQIRSENVAGVYEAQYWFGAGPDATGNLPPDVRELLEAYRVPTIA